MLARDPRFDVIDGMDGREFEAFVGQLLGRQGWQVEHIGGFDKGADLVVDAAGVRFAVQAKRWSTAVGIEAVRQVIDGVKRYGCDRGLVVTNNFFTEQAVECAVAWEIELWDRWKLGEHVDGEAPEVDRTICAECGIGVKPGVTEWCLRHPARYGGNVFCMAHQSRKHRRAA